MESYCVVAPVIDDDLGDKLESVIGAVIENISYKGLELGLRGVALETVAEETNLN